jgi:hypothetical protein
LNNKVTFFLKNFTRKKGKEKDAQYSPILIISFAQKIGLNVAYSEAGLAKSLCMIDKIR